uniref:Uncharacterized protein n=1 Tax=Salix viminalis TaxID=40686 RepID=A0A6N2K2M2_SALVM
MASALAEVCILVYSSLQIVNTVCSFGVLNDEKLERKNIFLLGSECMLNHKGFSDIFLGIKALFYPQRKELGGVQINGFEIFDCCPKKKQHQESIRASQRVYIYNHLSNLHHVTLHARYISCSDRTSSLCFCDKMPALETRENRPPEAGSIETPTTGMKCFLATKKKGERL